MATQEMDLSTHADTSSITVSAADNTLANSMSLHWDDTVDKMELIDLIEKLRDAFHKHISSTG